MTPPAPGDDAIARVGEGLLALTLPKSEWTHEGHCVAAVWLTMRRPDMDLARDLPAIIRAYNEATGTANTDSGGYHETITQFYIRAVRHAVDRLAPASLSETCAAVLASDFAARDFPLRFWTRETLFSVDARRRWVDPDRAPLAFDAVPLPVAPDPR